MKVVREGLGYRAVVVEEGVNLSVDRITERNGETYGELTVERVPDGHLMRSRLSLSATQARMAAARFLRERSGGVDWLRHLETLCVEVLRLERQGSPVVTIGKLPPRGSTEFLLRPMLPLGKPTILFGAEGTGKSTLAAAVAVTVSTGVPCLGGWSVSTPRKVLILDWESSREDWNDLIAAVSLGVDIEAPDVLYREMAQALTSDLHSVARYVSESDAGLLIIDSVGLASPSAREGADANDAAVRLFSALRHLKVTTLLIDHVSKTEDTGGNARPYGSVYKPALARATYELRAAEEADADGTRHIALYHRKHNTTAKQPPVGIAVKRDASVVMLKVEPMVVSDERIGRGMSLRDRIAGVLRGGPLLVEDISIELDEPADKVRTTLNRGRGSGHFVSLTTPGEKALRWANAAHPKHVSEHVPQGSVTTGGVLRTPTPGVSDKTPGPARGAFDGLRDLVDERAS